MDAFTDAARRLLSPAECRSECNSRRAVKLLMLRLYLSVPHLGSIGRVVEDTVSRGETERFEVVTLLPSSLDRAGCSELVKQCMSFLGTCPKTFRWLTGLTLTSLEFMRSDLPSLIGACDKLKFLSFRSCRLRRHSALKIDAPNSLITELHFIRFRCRRIKLVSLPKLRRLSCRFWRSRNPPLRLGYVPELLAVDLASHASTGQAPFALTECFSTNTRSLSKLYLNFRSQRIWIQPEHPKQLTAIFGNLTSVVLWRIFPECDLSWTLFFLEAAPALRTISLNRSRHTCAKRDEENTEKTNVTWKPSNDLKHLNLHSLVMVGFEEEDKVVNYIRLVMERATAFKGIVLGGTTCEDCHALDLESPRRSEVDEASRRRVKERLTHGSSSSVKISLCSRRWSKTGNNFISNHGTV